jgi:hypothetical protein
LNDLTYEYTENAGEHSIELSNGKRAYLREDGNYETVGPAENIDGIYRIVKGTNCVYKID